MTDNPIFLAMASLEAVVASHPEPRAALSALMYLAAQQTTKMSHQDAISVFSEARATMLKLANQAPKK